MMGLGGMRIGVSDWIVSIIQCECEYEYVKVSGV
jgi:hypothetical protein